MSIQKGLIKVIHIDDDESLQNIMKLYFEVQDPHIKLNQYTDGHTALKELNDSINCIITDYKMPHLDGLEIAKIIRKTSDIPIIIFTGQGSEEIASKAFSIGVNSYIQKSIDPSIYEVLIKEVRNHTERYSNAKLVEESELKYRTFLENSMDGITFIVDNQIRFCNRRAAEMMGYTKDELTGMKLSQLTTPELASQIEERTIRIQREEKVPERYESKVLRKDGSPLDVEYHVTSIEFEGEIGNLAVVQDISDRVRYDHRLEKLLEYTSCLNSVDSLESLYQVTYEILDVALGFKILDIIAVKEGYIVDVKRTGDNKESFRAPLNGPGITVRAVNTGETQLVNDISQDKDYLPGTRSVHMLSELAVPVYVKGKVFLVLNVESDKVNAFNEQDKKLLEIFAHNMGIAVEKLLYIETVLEQTRDIESQKHRTNFMIENAPYISIILNLNGEVKFVNQMFARVLGYSENDLMGKRYNQIPTLQPRDALKALKMLLSIRKGDIPEPFTMNFITKSGEYVKMEVTVLLYNSPYDEREIVVMARPIDNEYEAQDYMIESQNIQIENNRN